MERLFAAVTDLGRRHVASTDRYVHFVLDELAPARYAFARAIGERAHRPPIGHLMFARLVAEIGLRLGWIAAHAADGPAAVRSAIDGLAKRDMMHMRQAQAAVHLDVSRIQEAIDKVNAAAAPRQAEQLIERTPLARASYSLYRFSSALIHPGAGLRIIGGTPDMEVELRNAIVDCYVLAADILHALNPSVEPPDVDAVLAEDVLGLSPTAVGHRLERRLRPMYSPAPAVTDAGVNIRWERDSGEAITLKVVVSRESSTFSISATGSSPVDAFDKLLAAARDALA